MLDKQASSSGSDLTHEGPQQLQPTLPEGGSRQQQDAGADAELPSRQRRRGAGQAQQEQHGQEQAPPQLEQSAGGAASTIITCICGVGGGGGGGAHTIEIEIEIEQLQVYLSCTCRPWLPAVCSMQSAVFACQQAGLHGFCSQQGLAHVKMSLYAHQSMSSITCQRVQKRVLVKLSLMVHACKCHDHIH